MVALALAAAAIANLLPPTRFVLSALVTLFHEFGHAVAGWLLGHPSLPAFDFVYGGGFTHQGNFRLSIVLAIAGLLAFTLWKVRRHRPLATTIGIAAALWMLTVTAGWRREMAIAAAGHVAEFLLAGTLLYMSLSGRWLRQPVAERPLAAFLAFFVQIHSMRFAWKLIDDPSFLAWYRGGKSGAIMNDLEHIALDLTIRFGIEPGIEGVARALLAFSLLPLVAALAIHLKQDAVDRILDL